MTTSGFSWPNGKRVAVLVGLLLESWSDGKSPTYFTRTTPLKAGAVDHAGVQWSQFGGREGIWRLLSVLRSCDVSATVFCNALSAERYPDAVKAIVAAGHDIAAHGYCQDQYLSDMNPDQQRATIRKCLDILERQSGKRPDGWVSSVYSWDNHTVDALVQEGIAWHADALDATSPRRDRTTSGTIVALPWCDFVDNRVLRSSPNDFFDVYKGMLDHLRAHEPGGLIHIAVHSHFGGRPMMSAVFQRTLEYFRSFPDVWMPRHRELVRWFADQNVDEVPAAERLLR
jgi:Polysaccharide deacetylase